MPVTPTYPGVYIEEIPSGVRTITGVATSITAFLGNALRGPVNEPTTINNFGDFERLFGGLWVNSMMSYAVRDFYLNGGSQAIIVRLVNGATAASLNLPTGESPPNNFLVLNAASEGLWGRNLQASIDYDTRDADASPPNLRLFNLTVSEDMENGAIEKFLNVSTDTTDLNPYAVAGIAALAGLFSDDAVRKLAELFRKILQPEDERDDPLRENGEDENEEDEDEEDEDENENEEEQPTEPPEAPATEAGQPITR